MTYASGGLIQATDYNGFAASVNAIWGGGSGDSGYGQSTTLATVAAGNTVSASSWASLISRIDSMRNHQSNTTSGITQPASGGTINYLSTLSTQISTITTNRLLSNGVDQDTTGGQTLLTSGAATNGTTFTNALRTLEISVTFSSNAAMRYFFNAGGYIRWTPLNSAFAGNTLSTEFDATSAELSWAYFFAQLSRGPGAGRAPVLNAVGFYDISTTDTSIIYLYNDNATGGYNNGYVQCTTRLNAAPSSATVMYCRVYWQATSTGTGLNDSVVGTARLDVEVYGPRTTYLSNTWGTPTLAITVAG